MSLDWRKKSREGYFQIERHVFVKTDDLDYFTEQDLIKRYAEKRNMPIEAIADLYRVFMGYLNQRLDNPIDDEKGYYVPHLSRFMKKHLYVLDLAKEQDGLKFKKAKKQLDLYMRTGDHVKLC